MSTRRQDKPMQATPGPWHRCQIKGPPFLATFTGKRICTLKEQEDARETDANARLIQAAPLLLAAAEAVCEFDWCDSDADAAATIDTLRAALAAAKESR